MDQDRRSLLRPALAATETLLYEAGVWQLGAALPVAGPRCYTTARVNAGRVRHRAQVIARWVRDARAVGLPPIDAAEADAALQQLVEHAFGSTGQGIVRMEANTSGPWQGRPREIGREPETWTAMIAAVTHPGPSPGPAGEVGAKRADLSFYQAAWDELSNRSVDEALLVDESGRVVEGTRSNLIFVDRQGRLFTPPLDHGPVRGVARALLLEHLPEIEEGGVRIDELRGLDELISVNSVRGARAICEIDGQPVAGGEPGPWSVQLGALLDEHG